MLIRFLVQALLCAYCCSALDAVVGPIIGRVTDKTARILLEVDETASITMKLKAGTTEAGSVTRDMKPDVAYIFVFDNLAEKTAYEVSVEGVTFPVSSSFRTLPSNPTLADKLRFAFVACNRVWYTTENVKDSADDVWTQYAAKTTSTVETERIDYAFHLGDQFYSDDWGPPEGTNEWDRAVALLKNTSADNWAGLRKDIKAIYQKGYRDTFQYLPTRQALSNVPNLMFGDDHELVDDAGDIAEHNNKDSAEYFVIHTVRDLFMMYEWQLYEDVAGDFSDTNTPIGVVPTENRAQWSWGEYGFMMVDIRYAKYFQPTQNDNTPFVTGVQWGQIDSYIGQSTDNVKLLVVMSQIPIVLFDQDASETAVSASEYANDLEGTWEYQEHKEEQLRLLDTLRKWMESKAGRAVTLAGGDMHLGGYSRLEHNDEEIIQQLVVGPVSGDQKGGTATVALNALNAVLDDITVTDEHEKQYGKWEFDHWVWESKRNIGFLEADPSVEKWLSRVTHLMSAKQDEDKDGNDITKVVLKSPKNDVDALIDKLKSRGVHPSFSWMVVLTCIVTTMVAHLM